MPAGAFLRRPTLSGSGLRQSVIADPLVRSRYMRLFHASQDEIAEAFSKLTPGRLAADGVYRVYYVHAGEKLGYKLRRVRKGTPIFLMAGNVPFLIQACGNPLRPSLGGNDTSERSKQSRIPVYDPAETDPNAPPTSGPATAVYADARLHGRGRSGQTGSANDFVPESEEPFFTTAPDRRDQRQTGDKPLERWASSIDPRPAGDSDPGDPGEITPSGSLWPSLPGSATQGRPGSVFGAVGSTNPLNPSQPPTLSQPGGGSPPVLGGDPSDPPGDPIGDPTGGLLPSGDPSDPGSTGGIVVAGNSGDPGNSGGPGGSSSASGPSSALTPEPGPWTIMAAGMVAAVFVRPRRRRKES